MARILIVDDNKQNIYLMQSLLVNNGFEPDSAINGSDALERARLNPPDLVISDILMPVMDGFALCRALKSDDRLKHIPFVFYTATYVDSQDEDFALSLGAERFIVKPTSPDTLIELLKEIVEASRAGVKAAVPTQTTHDSDYYEKYSTLLVHKLESKLKQLEALNASMEHEIYERKQTEEKLKSNYSLLQLAGKTAQFGGWNVDLATDICTWSDIVADIHEMPHGYAPSVSEGIEFYAPEWRDTISRVFSDCAKKGVPFDEDMEIITKTGNRVWVRACGIAVRDPSGVIKEVQGSFQDITEQKRREQLLQESEERYKTMFDNSSAAILVWDPNKGIVTDSNSAALKYYGWPKERLVGMRAEELYDMPRDQLKERIRAQMRGDKERYEFRHRKSDGTITDVEIFAGPICISHKDYLFSIIHDISTRKAAEKERDAFSDRLAHYLSGSPIITYSASIVDGRFHFSWISQNIERIMGYSVEDAFTEDWWFKNIYPHDRSRVLSSISEAVKAGEITQEYRFLRKDRNVIWIRERLRIVNGKANETELVGTFEDVSDQRRTMAELNLKSSALDASANAIVITDSEGKIEWANQSFMDLTGYSRVEILDKNPSRLVSSGKHDSSFYKTLWETITAGKTWKGEICNKKKSGELYLEEMTITPVLDSDKRITHFIAVKSDITEKRAAQDKIEASLREKEVLLKEIHHRVKNNLQLISSLLSLSAGENDDSHYQQRISAIQRRITSISLAHEQFYHADDIARIDFGLYLHQIVDSILDQANGDAYSPAIEYSMERMLLGLEQSISAGIAISELVSNAIRFSSRHSGNRRTIQIRLYKTSNDHVVIEVCDNGPGIPEGVDTVHPNTLGMVLAATTAAQLNGSIDYKTENGTVASLRFPVAPYPE